MTADLDDIRRGPFLIDGNWTSPAGRQRFDIVTPSDETVFASVPLAEAADVDACVAAARGAFDTGPWPRLSHVERASYLLAIAEGIEAESAAIGAIWTREVGALISHGGHMAAAGAGLFRHFAGMATTNPFVERRTPTAGGEVGLLIQEPVGVVAAIIPWNAPILMLASKIAPALLAGCTVVVKTSPEAPLEAVLLGKICDAAGLPPGVLNIVMADREVSELLVRHEGVDKVSFTGSTAVGQRVASICGGRMARATLELGGKSAAIVLEDSPLDLVVNALVPQVGSLAMQFCSALSRVIVTKDRHDELVDALSAALAAVRVGDPTDSATEMGPMAMRRQLDRVHDYIASGIQDGCTLATGGGRPAGLDRGFYVQPTMFGDVGPDARIAREEIFGPVLCVTPARDEEEAIALANDTIFGLNNSVFTADPDRALKVARQLRSGTVGHNAFRSDFGIGFGGFKRSGIGREGGSEGLRPYLESKTVILEAEPSLVAV